MATLAQVIGPRGVSVRRQQGLGLDHRCLRFSIPLPRAMAMGPLPMMG